MIATTVCLQHIPSSCLLSKERSWTKHAEDAWDFGTTTKALEFVRKNNLHNVQIMVKLPEPAEAVILPVSESFTGTPGLKADSAPKAEASGHGAVRTRHAEQNIRRSP